VTSGIPDPLQRFSSLVQDWFRATLGTPTPVQRLGWPRIAAGVHTLLLAPTGSGKTLAAFLWTLDRLLTQPAEAVAPSVHTLYVSPLKALGYDIERNLQVPLGGIRALAASRGTPLPSDLGRTTSARKLRRARTAPARVHRRARRAGPLPPVRHRTSL